MLTNMRAFEAFSREESLAACVAFIKEKAAYALAEGFSPYIYRGSYTGMRWFVHTPDLMDRRRSAHTSNYCNLIVNRHWPAKGFPQREIICTNSIETTENYGSLYYVLPNADANMGICPKADFWYLDTLPGKMVVSDVNDTIMSAHVALHLTKNAEGGGSPPRWLRWWYKRQHVRGAGGRAQRAGRSLRGVLDGVPRRREAVEVRSRRARDTAKLPQLRHADDRLAVQHDPRPRQGGHAARQVFRFSAE